MGSLSQEGNGGLPGDFRPGVPEKVPLPRTHFNLGLSNPSCWKCGEAAAEAQVLGSALAFPLAEGERSELPGPG